MELSIFSLLFSICILYVAQVRAQTYVSSTVWVVPDGNTADLSRTYIEDITLQVTWNSVPAGYRFQTLSNLWVTTWDYDNTQFSQLLTKNVNTNNSGTYDWTIALPANVLSKDAKYVLRFKDLSSVFFVLDNFSHPNIFFYSNQTSSSASASSTILTSTVTTAPVTSTAAIATTPATSTSISNSGDSGLSTGAKVGIAVGVAAAALFITSSAYLIFRRRRNSENPPHEAPPYPPTDPPRCYEPPKQYYTGYTGNVAEIGGHERAELQAS
ncbi:hypothetical protein DSL72_002012 [Monilinia vaccinii-corymbosi]|uniref:Mid2 domain-containing protein n=1 Tax=Monilinia vaccinii-corymbosi TaxID=61207 RepID=A0A8A3PBI5_9HELO|nr:hypothetical protein DSL72_002012 [Monilinia vaccinii-corymbosi]